MDEGKNLRRSYRTSTSDLTKVSLSDVSSVSLKRPRPKRQREDENDNEVLVKEESSEKTAAFVITNVNSKRASTSKKTKGQKGVQKASTKVRNLDIFRNDEEFPAQHEETSVVVVDVHRTPKTSDKQSDVVVFDCNCNGSQIPAVKKLSHYHQASECGDHFKVGQARENGDHICGNIRCVPDHQKKKWGQFLPQNPCRLKLLNPQAAKKNKYCSNRSTAFLCFTCSTETTPFWICSSKTAQDRLCGLAFDTCWNMHTDAKCPTLVQH